MAATGDREVRWRPGGARTTRSRMRQRGVLLKSQARHVQPTRTALTPRNVQWTNGRADIVGESGQKILRDRGQ